MHSDFSEFSYSYAVTEELVTKNKAKVIGAPRFPSLYEEGKKGGYDVNIPLSGKPVFLQFKLSEYLERTNARECSKGILPVPYYRMHLRPARHSDQHQLLLDLEKSGESVFYIAPEFHLLAELNQHYLRKCVIVNSAAFSPLDVGQLPDDDDHYIVFEKQKPLGLFCSNSTKEIPKTSLEGGLPSALRDVPSRELGEEGLNNISKHMLSILENRASKPPLSLKPSDIQEINNVVSDRSTIEGLSYMSRTFFNAELVVLP